MDCWHSGLLQVLQWIVAAEKKIRENCTQIGWYV